MKAWLLKLHRWVALLFALPLVFLLGTGLILSFEPWLVVRAIDDRGDGALGGPYRAAPHQDPVYR